jgi:hypothetical protein
LARAFWIVACGDVLLFLIWLLQVENSQGGQFAGLAVFFLLVLLGLAVVITGIVALIRKPAAYGVALALLVVPPLWWGALIARDFLSQMAAPSAESLKAGRGYFFEAPDRALADAIVSGDARKVASLAPAANLNAIGQYGMTFMRLALENGHAKPDVVKALLEAGVEPDSDYNLLFGFNFRIDMIDQKNGPLLQAVIESGIDLNRLDRWGSPRFFSALRWPEGLALMLDHGANTEAEDEQGNTAINWAVMYRYWPSIDVLLEHGAHVDHVAHDGRTLRDIVLETSRQLQTWHDPIPPQLAALKARLR